MTGRRAWPFVIASVIVRRHAPPPPATLSHHCHSPTVGSLPVRHKRRPLCACDIPARAPLARRDRQLSCMACARFATHRSRALFCTSPPHPTPRHPPRPSLRVAGWSRRRARSVSSWSCARCSAPSRRCFIQARTSCPAPRCSCSGCSRPKCPRPVPARGSRRAPLPWPLPTARLPIPPAPPGFPGRLTPDRSPPDRSPRGTACRKRNGTLWRACVAGGGARWVQLKAKRPLS